MDGDPFNYALKSTISKSRVRFTFPLSQDWTIMKHTSEHHIQFVDKTRFAFNHQGPPTGLKDFLICFKHRSFLYFSDFQ